MLSERVGGTVSVGVRFMARGRSVPVYTQCVYWVCTREQCECWVGNRSCRGWRLTTLAAPLDSGGGGGPTIRDCRAEALEFKGPRARVLPGRD